MTLVGAIVLGVGLYVGALAFAERFSVAHVFGAIFLIGNALWLLA